MKFVIATLYCNIKAAKHTPKYDKDYVIILGCMIKKDGTETIVDICRMSYGTKASVESSKNKIILSDRMIEHHTKDSPEVLNVVSKDMRLKKVARAFVQPEVHEYMSHLKKAPGFESMNPPKPQPVKKFFMNIKNLFVSQCINRFQK